MNIHDSQDWIEKSWDTKDFTHIPDDRLVLLCDLVTEHIQNCMPKWVNNIKTIQGAKIRLYSGFAFGFTRMVFVSRNTNNMIDFWEFQSDQELTKDNTSYLKLVTVCSDVEIFGKLTDKDYFQEVIRGL